MKYLKRVTLGVLIGMWSCGFAYGASHAMPAANSQQNKMAECNKVAGDKKGDERKTFMSSCLSKKEKPMTQQEKMTACNKEATGKKGDDRKQFMSNCLKADKK